jgi:hypothetical protein
MGRRLMVLKRPGGNGILDRYQAGAPCLGLVAHMEFEAVQKHGKRA